MHTDVIPVLARFLASKDHQDKLRRKPEGTLLWPQRQVMGNPHLQLDPAISLVEDLGLDSFDVDILGLELEEHFRITLPAGGLHAVATVEDLQRFVQLARSRILQMAHA